MILNQQLTALITDIQQDMANGQAGTDSTLFVKTQEGLITPVSATNVALTEMSNTNNSISVTHFITTSLGNGSTLTEFEVNNNTISYNRSVKAGLAKTSQIEYTVFHTFTVEVIL
jgi:hypothetical protein